MMMELYTITETAAKLQVPYDKVYYLINSVGLCQQPGDQFRTSGGGTWLITDKGYNALADYIAAENRMIARRPKTYEQKIAEQQKQANAERTKKLRDALPKQELQLVQNNIKNMQGVTSKKEEMTLLKKREAELLKMLNMEDD